MESCLLHCHMPKGLAVVHGVCFGGQALLIRRHCTGRDSILLVWQHEVASGHRRKHNSMISLSLATSTLDRCSKKRAHTISWSCMEEPRRVLL